MNILIEILPILCGGILSLLLHLSQLKQGYRYAVVVALSLIGGIFTNQIAGEPIVFVVFDMAYIAISASIGLLLVKRWANNIHV